MPDAPEPPPAGPPGEGEDPFAPLREHVRQAHAAAERLAFEAAREAGEATPPSGWASPTAARELGGELRALADLVESLRMLLPAELREQLNELIRQTLLLIRAIIDWLMSRLDGEPAEPEPEVRDIPIT